MQLIAGGAEALIRGSDALGLTGAIWNYEFE